MNSMLRHIRKFRKDHLYEPPDGGWAWVVAVAANICYGTFGYINIVFSIAFIDTLENMGHKTTGAAFILSSYNTVSSLCGIFCAPLIKLISYKVTSILGAVLLSVGLMGAAFATNIWHMFVSFSLVAGIGSILVQSSLLVSINTYFKKWRATALGIACTGVSLGQLILPPLVVFLKKNYGQKSSVLFLGALALNAVPASFLYHPLSDHSYRRLKEEAEEMYPLNGDNRRPDETEEPISEPCSWWRRLVSFFDLELLADPIFVNILIGITIIYACSINLGLIFPLFFYHGLGFSMEQTAIAITCRSAGDLLSRIILPRIFDKFSFRARHTFLSCTILGTALRVATALQTKLIVICSILFVEGLCRGIVMVYYSLCVTNYCSQIQIPTAIGLYMFLQGIMSLIIGPLTGYIRDESGDYSLVILIQCGLMAAAMLSWIIEMSMTGYRKRRQTNHVFVLVKET